LRARLKRTTIADSRIAVRAAASARRPPRQQTWLADVAAPVNASLKYPHARADTNHGSAGWQTRQIRTEGDEIAADAHTHARGVT
jgi:hypothetical protein